MGEAVLQIFTPPVIVAALFTASVFLARNLILERLKKAIQHEYDTRIKKHEAKLKLDTDTAVAEVKAKLDMELELAKLKLGPYSEEQFKTYNTLWVSLCELEESVSALWLDLNQKSFNKFALKLKKAHTQLEQSSLLVEPQHYDELRSILNTFITYKMGKKTLMDFWSKREQGEHIDSSTLKSLIEQNQKTKEKDASLFAKPIERKVEQIGCRRRQWKICNLLKRKKLDESFDWLRINPP